MFMLFCVVEGEDLWSRTVRSAVPVQHCRAGAAASATLFHPYCIGRPAWLEDGWQGVGASTSARDAPERYCLEPRGWEVCHAKLGRCRAL